MSEIGQLDQRISLQHRTLTDDGAGGATEAWTEYAEVWASVRPMTGRERENAMRNEATSNYVVTVRYRSDILERDRIVWRSKELNIRFIKNAGPRPPFLDLEVEMGVSS